MAQGVTGTKTNVAASASSITLLERNADREHFKIVNDSAAWLYVDETGGTASTTDYTVSIPPGDYYESGEHVSVMRITGIWASAVGTARLSEWR